MIDNMPPEHKSNIYQIDQKDCEKLYKGGEKGKKKN